MSDNHWPTNLPEQVISPAAAGSPQIEGERGLASSTSVDQEAGIEPTEAGSMASEAESEIAPDLPPGSGRPPEAMSERAASTLQQKIGVNRGVVAASLTLVVAELLAHHELSNDYVQRCVARYAPGPRFDEASTLLREFRVVVIVADADTGRHEAAVNLLYAMEVRELRELRHRAGAAIDLTVLNTQQSTGWLLDLRGGRSLPSTFAREVAGRDTLDRLIDAQSYLVLIVPPSVWAQAGEGAGKLTLAWEATSAIEIVRRRISAAGCEDSDRWVEQERIRTHLRFATPAEAVRWADEIESVSALPAERLDFSLLPEAERADVKAGRKPDHDLRAQMVVAAFSDWRDHLLSWCKQNHDARLLCFLVTSAVLEGRSVLEIHDQIESLHQTLAGRKAQFENVGLNGPGIIELVDIIGARTTGDLRVEFTRPGYGDAVLDYFWVDRQPMQQAFLHWMCALPEMLDEKESAARVTQRIAAYALRWTLRNGKFTFLQKIAESWGSDRRYQATAVDLISAAALDPTFGKAVRDKLLEWSKPGGDYSAALRATVAAVCAGPLSRVYLTPALTRVGHLAKSDDPLVVKAVGDAMRTLWSDEAARADVRRTLERWLASDNPKRRNAVRHTFLALVGLTDEKRSRPMLMDLLESAEGGGLLVDGWRVVLEDPTQRSRTRDVLSTWLDATFSDLTIANSFAAMLVDAATRHNGDYYNAYPSLTAIYAVNRWQDRSSVGNVDSRRKFGDELVGLIHHRDPLGNSPEAIRAVPAGNVNASAVA
ncbi:hypothetical protein AB0H63_25590 [Micromonospora echinospora]|uniref:hypothetical protein n=1 Tax=Micromonospora echinospora TaxID=1877 RepID=UPI0033D89E35